MMDFASCIFALAMVAGPPAVKGFDAAAPTASVPGFGGTTQSAKTEPARNAQATASKETSEKASKDAKEPARPKSYRFLSPYERPSFPSGVPEWFKQRDTDFDGQVFMREYTSSWSDEAARNFTRLDANGDGVITARESVMRRDLEAEPRHTRAAVPIARVAEIAPEAAAAAAPAEAEPISPSSIPQAFLGYADGVIRHFDTDRDGVLTVEEWKVMPAPPASADADGNGQITVGELAVWYVRKR